MTTNQKQADLDRDPWTAEDLRAIAGNDDLFGSPLREDGTT
jgi:hypothetical protein